MNAKSHSVEQLLRWQRRWNQYAWPLIVMAVGLAGTLAFAWHRHPSLARLEKWGHLPQWWGGGLAVTFMAAAIVWWVRRRSVLEAAQTMDAQWAAKNRLETAAALSSAPDAMARAQREETAGFVRQAHLRARGIPLWIPGGLVAALIFANLFLFASWARPGSDSAKETKNVAPAKPTVEARIDWNSPEEEIKAAAVEEVPLEAVADSAAGFHDAVLEISVNGESKPRIPVTMAELKSAGQHTIQTSIYMDQLGVKPYDIVSYNLRAQRNGIQKLPDTVSPVQFVEIKPLREDVHESPPTQNPSKCFNYITAIKSAQLKVMKENFVLAHSELSRDNADWKNENQHVGADQKTIGEKTGEVVDLMVSNGAPEEIVNLIRQARPEMADAAQKITSTENEPALAPQGKALALITQVEKYLAKCIRQGRPLVQKVADPFDKKELELKRRDATPAGEMEILAREQARLAEDIVTTNAAATNEAAADPEKITGTPVERESQISRRVVTLLTGTNYTAETLQHLQQGRNQAQASLLELGIEDLAGAREPAAESARELHLAVEAAKRAAEQVAKDELADVLRALSDAAGGARVTPAQISDAAARQQATNVTQQVRNVARSLAEAARWQQENGTTKAAGQLNDLAKALAAADLQKALQSLREQPRDAAVAKTTADKLQDVADRAGTLRNNGPLSPTEIARLAERLERAHANIQRLTAPNAASKPSNASGKSPGSSPGNQPGTSPGKVPGNSPGNSPGKTGSENSIVRGSESSDTASFASVIIGDVRESLLEVQPALPRSVTLTELRAEFHMSPGADAQYADQLAFLQKIDPSLEGVIKLLRAEVPDKGRPFQLTDDALAQAPSAYRPAVADYFEQLSRDYQTDSKAAGK